MVGLTGIYVKNLSGKWDLFLLQNRVSEEFSEKYSVIQTVETSLRDQSLDVRLMNFQDITEVQSVIS